MKWKEAFFNMNIGQIAITMVGCCVALGTVTPANAISHTMHQVQSEHPFLYKGLYPSWSAMTPEQGLKDARQALADARRQVEELCKVTPEQANYDNVFGAYEKLNADVDQVGSLLYHMSSVVDNPELRKTQEALIPEMTAFSSELIGNEQLWHVIKTAAAQSWVKELSPARQRFVQQVVDSFRDSGADLSPEGKKRRSEIMEELSGLTLQFGKNVLDSQNAWELVIDDKAKLEGLSENWLTAAAAAAKKKGYGTDEKPCWLITLDYTSVGDVMRLCNVEETRRKCWEGQNTIGRVGKYDNAPLVARVMELRRELASLLGFKTFADLKAAHRMVGSGDNAMNFIDNMMQKVKPAYEKECAEFLEFVSRQKGEKVEAIAPWDRRYYMNMLSRERYNFDPELLRPYQEYNRVLKGMFSIYQNLLGITITELPTVHVASGSATVEGAVEVWHPEVRVFAVSDAATGAHLGSFYLDLFPRASKRAGAWVMPLKYGTPAQNGKPHTPHLASLAGNMTAAVGDKPALFSHYDVETLFHEFGHMMHAMLGDTEIVSHCGTSVTWDFVELPSQLFENWTWDAAGIATYGYHYESGEPIPAELVQRLLASRFFMPASDIMGQLCIAKLDMEMHVNYNEKFKGLPLDEATDRLLDPWRLKYTERSSSIMRHLTHCITGGYAAGYYSYKWAEVLAADAFTRFAKEGVMNTKTGMDFRREILSQGDSKPAGEIYRNFMGRDPNPDALLQKQGLIK